MNYCLHEHVENSVIANQFIYNYSNIERVADFNTFLRLETSQTKIYYFWEQSILQELKKFNSLMNLLSHEKINLLKQNNIKVVIDISTGEISISEYSKIVEFIQHANFELDNVYVIVNSRFEYDQFVKLAGHPVVIYSGRNEILFYENILTHKRPKRFLFLSRRWSLERMFNFLDLRKRGILDNSIYSFTFNPDPYQHAIAYTQSSVHDAFKAWVERNNCEYTREIFEYWVSEKDTIFVNEPYWIGNTNEVSQQSTAVSNAFNETYMSLCVETRWSDDPLHFQPSEKIYKCCYFRHPFVVYSTPKFLDAWNKSGYKSFSPWINEEYDNILHQVDRIRITNDLVEQLNQMNLAEFRKLMALCGETINHNQQLFTQKARYLTDKNMCSSGNSTMMDIFSEYPPNYWFVS